MPVIQLEEKDVARELHIDQDRTEIVFCRTPSDWHEVRATMIGASEGAALHDAGDEAEDDDEASPWATKFSVYAGKAAPGYVPPGIDEDEATEDQEFGLVMEPGIAELASRRLGLDVLAPPPYTVMRLRAKPYIGATPDRFTRERDGTIAVLELKSAEHYSRRKWVDPSTKLYRVPRYAQVQVGQQVLVAGPRPARIALLDARKCRPLDVPVSTEFLSYHEDVVDTFWRDHILARVPPDMVGSDLAVVKRMHPFATEAKSIALGDAGLALFKKWRADHEEMKRWEEAKDQDQAALAIVFGDAEIGVLPDGRRVTYRNQSRSTKAHPVLAEVAASLAVVKDYLGSAVTGPQAERMIELCEQAGIALGEAMIPKVSSFRVMRPPVGT